MIQTWFNIAIKNFRSDFTKDYFIQPLALYFQEKSIIYESSCLNTLKQNKVVEKENEYLLAYKSTFISE